MGIVAIGASQGSATAASASSARQAQVKGSTPTIQEWNWDTVADEPAENASLPGAIKLFEKTYHVKVVNVEMTLEEQNDKLPLAFSSKSSAPTVSQTNEGFGSMGRLVTDKELQPLTSYNKTYNWYAKVGKTECPVQLLHDQRQDLWGRDLLWHPGRGLASRHLLQQGDARQGGRDSPE